MRGDDGGTLDLFAQSDEIDRLETQRGRILSRRLDGPATGAELAEIGGFRYGARIFELRWKGWIITLTERDRRTGRTVYEITRDSRGTWRGET